MPIITFPSLHFLLLLSFFLFTFLPFLVISQSPPSELEILLQVKQQWRSQPPMDSWSSTSPCQWPGISCTGGDSVTGISLNSQNIAGEIPASICDLKNLTLLDLGNNSIPGTFPTILYNCTHLQTLDLSANYFVGELPNDINKLSPNLQHLVLSSNNFTGDIPISLAQLKGLITLYLDSNLFNGTFPSELGNLENLEELVLAYNPFSPMNLPKEYGKLKSLEFLWMTQCNLIGEIPNEFANLTSLQHLDLVGNYLEGEIPSGLFLLQNLTFLYLYKNRLSGGIPTSIKTFNLTEIDLSQNNLTGTISEEFGNLSKLQALHLFQNQFSGPVPSSIGQLPSLKTLRLFNNRFSGLLPPELGLHSNLEDFEVSDNGFTGQLPQHLCSGQMLLGVVAFNNYLNGTIPTSLGQCNSLLVVYLYNNSISGEVPQGLWTSQHMMIILLSNNQLSGLLPEKLAWNLSRVDISSNKFSGRILQSVSTNWRNLQVLKASNNLITGTVPLELTSLSLLDTLLLDGNQLTGELPSEIISWKKLNNLNLSHNKLSGSVPTALGSLPVLTYLDLSDNQFSGQIPPELGQLKLTSLNFSSNQLTGSIPYGLDNAAYKASYLNTHLCSNTGLLALPKCSNHRGNQNLSSKHLALIIVLALFLVIFAILFSRTLIISIIRQRKTKQGEETWILTQFHKLNFTEDEVLNNLTENNVIGYGGSGKVYQIPINQSGDVVAVKKIWNTKKMSNSLEKVFNAEVQILGTIRHLNIVKLLCCLSSEHSRLLVYEYMENQSLDKWIHSCKKKSVSSMSRSIHHAVLNWPARLKIAIDAAKGLSYMHHDCTPPIIHRDVKSSNILLDSELNAKIADFGLAKILAKSGEEVDTVSAVAGSFGYMAPEYCHTIKVNEKIDVYSFGVVLLELVTGKEAHIGDEYSNLAEWAWRLQSQGYPIEDVFDKEVKEPCYLEAMTHVFIIGLRCTDKLAYLRPSMKEVLQQLQRHNIPEDSGKGKANSEHEVSPFLGASNYVSSCRNSKRTEEHYFEV